MKKLPFLITLILVAAMLLSACSEAGEGGQTAGTIFPTDASSGEVVVPGAEGTVEPTTDPITGSDGGPGDAPAEGTATAPAAGEAPGGADTTPTADSGGAGQALTPTLESGAAGGNQTPTADGGAGAAPTPTMTLVTGGAGGTGGTAGGTQTQTPVAGGESIPETGQAQQFALLSDILKMQVMGQDGNQLGSVGGVLIDRAPSAVAGAEAQSTPTVGSANPGAVLGGLLAAVGERPQITFVLVSVSSGQEAGAGTTVSTGASAQDDDSNVLIPWQAFDVSGLSMGASSGPAAAGQQNADDLALVLTVDANTLAAAPRFEAGEFNGQVGSEVAEYWAGEIAGIPATGQAGAQEANQVLIRGQIGSISVRGAAGENLGQARDFVVDTETGELAYAVLSGGPTAQGRMYVVPTGLLSWQAGPGASSTQGNNPGTFQMNVPAQVLSIAPSVGSVEEIEMNAEWFEELDEYWAGGAK